MPVNFLSSFQRESYGRYYSSPSRDELTQFFHLSDDDRTLIIRRRGAHNRLGFAIQLGTVRFLGTFLQKQLEVPLSVVQIMANQLDIVEMDCLQNYQTGEQRWEHAVEIQKYYHYQEITNPIIGFRLCRWLCVLSWTGTNRPSVLFDSAKNWLLSQKVLLPGISILERLVAQIRIRMETRLWRILVNGLNPLQKKSLENLLIIPENSRHSLLDRLRSGPIRVSAPALVKALARLQDIRNLGIHLPATRIPHVRLASLARIASSSKVTVIARLPRIHRLAMLTAFVYCLESTANDDALDLLNLILKELFGKAKSEHNKRRLRTLKDLDQAATHLADASQVLLDHALPEKIVRSKIYHRVPRAVLEESILKIRNLVQPPDDIYFRELELHYRSVRLFLPAILKHLHFDSNLQGVPVVEAFIWLRNHELHEQPTESVPREIIRKHWKNYVIREDGILQLRAYVLCFLKEFYIALNRRDVFVTSSWRYTDPCSGLLKGLEWETVRPMICRTLGLSSDPKPVLAALTEELDQNYRAIIARLPQNSAVRFETIKGDRKSVV